MELCKIYNESCLETMGKMPDGFVDLVVTSPPYDDLRTYTDDTPAWTFDIFRDIAQELWRVVKDGGVVVWVVGDATVNGSETGTSFRQALYFQEIGFNLHDTMIYEKNSVAFPAAARSKRYTQIFEYMFVFSKGIPIKGRLLCDKPNKWAGHTNWGNNTQYNANGERIQTNNIKPINNFSARNNIWKYTVGFNDPTDHPAVFPEQLARDHILSWSDANDVVYDPFGGSMTTAKVAHQLNRRWIMSEVSAKYCESGQKRLAPYLVQPSLFSATK